MFTLRFATDAAAFFPDDDDSIADQDVRHDERAEVARILDTIAKRIRQGDDHGLCMDRNGNSVGQWSLG